MALTILKMAQGPSIMCRLTCPIASRPSWLSTDERVKNDPWVKAYYAKHGLPG